MLNDVTMHIFLILLVNYDHLNQMQIIRTSHRASEEKMSFIFTPKSQKFQQILKNEIITFKWTLDANERDSSFDIIDCWLLIFDDSLVLFNNDKLIDKAMLGMVSWNY